MFDTPIWAEFTVPLDPATVTDSAVYLKVDTRRLPISVRWDSPTRRVIIQPLVALDVREVLTVELTSRLRTDMGPACPDGFFWQFTTISVRTPVSPQPLDRTINESPFVSLRWGGLTESRAGPVEYTVRAAHDSAAVLDSLAAPIATIATGYYGPRARWPQDRTTWWAIEARNLDTGERAKSAAWRFECLPTDTPTDTIDLAPVDYGWFDEILYRGICNGDSIVSGDHLIAAARWAFEATDSNRKLAGAVMELTPFSHWQPFVALGASVWMAAADWPYCALGSPGPPFAVAEGGKLADVVILRPDRVIFASDALTAHLEAMGRWGGQYGYVLRSTHRIAYWGSTAGGASRARLRAVTYRQNPIW